MTWGRSPVSSLPRPSGSATLPRSAMAKRLLLGGCALWLMVILTHAAERWHILPGMGWGLPNSPGHYLDLASAIGGAVLLMAAVLAKRR